MTETTTQAPQIIQFLGWMIVGCLAVLAIATIISFMVWMIHWFYQEYKYNKNKNRYR